MQHSVSTVNIGGWGVTTYSPIKTSAFDELNKLFGYTAKGANGAKKNVNGTLSQSIDPTSGIAAPEKINFERANFERANIGAAPEKINFERANIGAAQMPNQPDWYAQAVMDSKANFDKNQQQLDIDRKSALADVKSMYNQVMNIYNSSTIDANALLGKMKSAIQNTVTGIANAYNNQSAREGERVDALIASGAVGGNAYRAYQAHTQTARDLMSQAIGQIAQVTLSSTESLMNAGIKLSEIDQARSNSANAAIAALAGTQADIMMNYSKMLTENVVNAQASFQNLMQLNIQQIGQEMSFITENRKIDAEIRANELNALIANLGVEADIYKTKMNVEADIYKTKMGVEADIYKTKMGVEADIYKTKMNAALENKAIDANKYNTALTALTSLEQSLISKNQSAGLSTTSIRSLL